MTTEEKKKGYNVQFYINEDQYKVMVRLAELLFKNGAIKVNTVNALAKATTFTQVNLYLQYEAKEKAYEQKQIELDQKQLELEKRGLQSKYQGFDYVPNLGTY